ncbi:MAG: hypothetical protein KA100_00930 [Rickettsiales bacterium]|nr:hypothetical protein [Rickettsiales bacterium]
MSDNFHQISAAQIIKFALKSILFPSVVLGLFGGLIFFVRANVDPMPLMIFGFVAGFIASVTINFSKIREFRTSRSAVRVAQ